MKKNAHIFITYRQNKEGIMIMMNIEGNIAYEQIMPSMI